MRERLAWEPAEQDIELRNVGRIHLRDVADASLAVVEEVCPHGMFVDFRREDVPAAERRICGTNAADTGKQVDGAVCGAVSAVPFCGHDIRIVASAACR